MKKRLLAALLSGCVALSGCASLLERDYVSVTPHNSTKTDEGTSSVLRVESYQELVNSLIYFISSGAEDGVIRLYMDSSLVEETLRTARVEVLQEYPLGAYAVQNITFESDPLVAFSEVHAAFTYRRTPQQVASIVSATGITAVRNALTAALENYADECVLRITYFDQDADFVRSLVQQAYYTIPNAALEYPEMEINIYPDSGKQRIVEVLFHYETEAVLLSERSVLMEQAAARLAQELPAADSADTRLTAAAKAILNDGGYIPGGGRSAYDALLDGGADDEGLALAMALVCQELDLSCKVARGFLNGESHFWNLVEADDGWRHMDLSRYYSLSGFYTDETWLAGGYLWDETTLPSTT